MEETESQLVSVFKLSYSRAHVLNHHTIETKKLMNEWMIVGDESRWLLVIWRQINLIRAYLDQSHFQLLFSISYLGTARWHHNLFVYSYNFLPPVPAKYKTEVLLTNVSGCLTYLNSWEVWAWQHWAPENESNSASALVLHHVESWWWALSIPRKGQWWWWGEQSTFVTKGSWRDF